MTRPGIMAPEDERDRDLEELSALRAILHGAPDPILVVDRFANLVWANKPALEWSGWTLDELRSQPLIDLIHPGDRHTAIGALLYVQEHPLGTLLDLRFRVAGGTYRHFELRGRSALNDPNVNGIILIGRDITERRRWEVGAGDSNLLQAIINNAPGITMLLGPDGTVRGASRALSTLTGRRLADTLNRHMRDLVTPDDQHLIDAQLNALVSGAKLTSFEAAITVVTGGTAIPMSFNAANLLDDESVQGIVVTASDITVLAQARQRLHYLATHDSLTTLPNRTVAINRLERALEFAQRHRVKVSVVFGDLDDFKQINDRHGHLAGDYVLVEFASRLRQIIRERDVAARIGGDEFLLIVEPAGEEFAQLFAARVEQALASPIVLPSGDQIRLSISLGIATGEGSESATELLARADADMYRKKPRRPDR